MDQDMEDAPPTVNGVNGINGTHGTQGTNMVNGINGNHTVHRPPPSQHPLSNMSRTSNNSLIDLRPPPGPSIFDDIPFPDDDTLSVSSTESFPISYPLAPPLPEPIANRILTRFNSPVCIGLLGNLFSILPNVEILTIMEAEIAQPSGFLRDKFHGIYVTGVPDMLSLKTVWQSLWGMCRVGGLCRVEIGDERARAVAEEVGWGIVEGEGGRVWLKKVIDIEWPSGYGENG